MAPPGGQLRPTQVLSLAERSADSAIDGHFDSARGNSPTLSSPSTIVDHSGGSCSSKVPAKLMANGTGRAAQDAQSEQAAPLAVE
jgi:hypothetical protein